MISRGYRELPGFNRTLVLPACAWESKSGKSCRDVSKIPGDTTAPACADGCLLWFGFSCREVRDRVQGQGQDFPRSVGSQIAGLEAARRGGAAESGRAGGPGPPPRAPAGPFVLPLWACTRPGAAARGVSKLKRRLHSDSRRLPENLRGEIPPERTGK